MDAQDLLIAFEDQTTLPVDVNDVLKVLREQGHADDVSFIGADLDENVLQGAIKVWHHRDGLYVDPKRLANIYYHRGLDKAWQRLVCCKELLHLLDDEAVFTGTPAEIEQLAEEIGIPPAMQNPFKACAATNIDRIAEYRAAALLLPNAARDVLLPKYEAGEISIDDIARLADIPRKYVSIMMRKTWDDIYLSMVSRPLDDEDDEEQQKAAE